MDTMNSIRIENGYEKDAFTYYPVLIIGAGASGIAMGCRLKKKLGFDQFRMFERQSGIGGTWWINRYPGVACDVPCALYSFSWEPLYTSTELYPSGKEILKYLHNVASKYQIVDKIQFNTDISELRYLKDEEVWEATLTHLVPGMGDLSHKQREARIAQHGERSVYLRQEKVQAKIAISCVGGLVEPKDWPENIPGREDFQGQIVHSARWKDVNMQDKDVVVIGTGCSAAQMVPAILKEPYDVKSLTQIMRSPPWVVAKIEEPSGKEKYARTAPKVFRRLPILGFMLRTIVFFRSEQDWFQIFTEKFPNARKKLESSQIQRMKRIVPEKYHEIMTPNYTIGCKRRIFDPDRGWLRSMNDPRFLLTTQPLKSVRNRAVVLGAGQTYPPDTAKNSAPGEDEVELPADVIVLANGFNVSTWIHPLNVIGKDSKSLHDVWNERGGPQAYLGMAMDGMPNFFIIFGPNTATGHSSVLLAAENMVELTLKLIAPILRGEARTVEVKKDAELKWTRDIQRELKDTTFITGGCNSWYHTDNGWNSVTYSRSQIDFTFRCMFPKYSDWDKALTPKGIRRKQLKQAVQLGALLLIILGSYWAKTSGTSPIRFARESGKVAVFELLGMVNRGITMLQEAI